MPNTTNQTTYVLLNNELEKIQGRLDDIDEKINTLQYGVNLIIGRIKDIQYSSELKKPSLVDSLPDDTKLDVLEAHEGTCMDFSRVSDDQLTDKELAPFTPPEETTRLQKIFESIPDENSLDSDGNLMKKPSLAKAMYNSCLTDEQLDAIEKKEMEDYVKNV